MSTRSAAYVEHTAFSAQVALGPVAICDTALLGSPAQIHMSCTTAAMQVPACDPGTFFPVECNFTATKTLCDIQVRCERMQMTFATWFCCLDPCPAVDATLY